MGVWLGSWTVCVFLCVYTFACACKLVHFFAYMVCSKITHHSPTPPIHMIISTLWPVGAKFNMALSFLLVCVCLSLSRSRSFPHSLQSSLFLSHTHTSTLSLAHSLSLTCSTSIWDSQHTCVYTYLHIQAKIHPFILHLMLFYTAVTRRIYIYMCIYVYTYINI